MSESPSVIEKVEELKLDDDVVDPWNVASTSDAGVDYDKLIGSNEKTKIVFLIFHLKK